MLEIASWPEHERRRRGHGWRARHREVHEGDASHRHKHGKTDEGEHECDAAA